MRDEPSSPRSFARLVLWALLPLPLLAVWSWVAHGSLAPMAMIPLAAVLGPLVGLASSAPYFTATFKVALAAALLVAAALVGVGVRHRTAWWGRVAAGAGVWLWVGCGFVGFGPQ